VSHLGQQGIRVEVPPTVGQLTARTQRGVQELQGDADRAVANDDMVVRDIAPSGQGGGQRIGMEVRVPLSTGQGFTDRMRDGRQRRQRVFVEVESNEYLLFVLFVLFGGVVDAGEGAHGHVLVS
jgi:hypothetical protein